MTALIRSKPARDRRHLRPLAVALASLMLLACGGGSDLAGGVGSGGSGLAQGLVTGFGSVYIDGVRYDDADAETVLESADGQRVAARLELGQRVRALHDGQGKATRLIVDAAVVGAVTAVDAGAGTLKVAAQTVRIGSDPADGPLTRFGGGFESLADVRIGDDIEVHGSPVFDAAVQGYEIRATRVSKLDGRSHYRVSGAASGLTADRFQLNGLTVVYGAEVVKPADATLSEGASVVVFGTQIDGDVLTATAVRVLRDEADAPQARTQLALGGFVRAWDATVGEFVVDGQTVRLGNVTPTPSGATVQVGAYARVGGVVAADGVLDASRVSIRTTADDDELATIRLSGEITDLVEGPGFLVRGVPVDGFGVTPAANCPQPLDEGTLVQVRAMAQIATDVVKAMEIRCDPPMDGQQPRELLDQGLLWPVDPTTNTFGLVDARTGRTVTVRWTDTTAFFGLPRPGSADAEIQMLRTVRVEGYQGDDGIVVARVVRDISRAAGQRDGDRFRPRPGQPGTPEPWITYRQRPTPR